MRPKSGQGFLSQGSVPNVDKICAIGHGVTGASPGAYLRLPGGLWQLSFPLVDEGLRNVDQLCLVGKELAHLW